MPTRIEYLDIGGGLAFQVEDEGMLAFGRAVASLPGIGRFQLITEFGQWVHAPAGIVCTRVEYVDDHGDGPARAFVHVGADLFTREVYAAPRAFRFTVHDAAGRPVSPGPTARYDIVGPLCFAGDRLAADVELPVLSEGSWLAIHDTGANSYGLWSRHCSRDIPAVVGWSEADGPTLLQHRTAIHF